MQKLQTAGTLSGDGVMVLVGVSAQVVAQVCAQGVPKIGTPPWSTAAGNQNWPRSLLSAAFADWAAGPAVDTSPWWRGGAGSAEENFLRRACALCHRRCFDRSSSTTVVAISTNAACAF